MIYRCHCPLPAEAIAMMIAGKKLLDYDIRQIIDAMKFRRATPSQIGGLWAAARMSRPPITAIITAAEELEPTLRK